MLRHINIGPAALQTSLVVYLLAFYIAIEVTRRYAPKRNIDGNLAQNALTLSGIAGLLGARLSYALYNWSIYKGNLGDWFSITPQGLYMVGGIAFGIIVIFVYVGWRKVAIRRFLDALVPGIGILLLLVPLGFLADGSVIGKPSTLPWAIDLQQDTRHPTQVYAMIGSGLALVIWWKWIRHRSLEGESFLFILAGNAITWLFVGLLLAEPALVLRNYRLVQILSWAVIIAVTFLWSLWTDAQLVPEHKETSFKT